MLRQGIKTVPRTAQKTSYKKSETWAKKILDKQLNRCYNKDTKGKRKKLLGVVGGILGAHKNISPNQAKQKKI